MAKPGVSYEEVVATAVDLEKQGENLSVERIKELLGNRGSLATINRFLKEWKGQLQGTLAGTTQAFNLTSETMQEPSNNASEDAGNLSAANASSPAEPTSGNTIDPQVVVPVQNVVQDESTPPVAVKAAEAPKHAPRVHQNRNNHHVEEPKEVYQAERLEDLDDNALIIKIRRLETSLAKEQSRREAAEKMAEDAKQYADIIKEQIGQRIADLRQTMEVNINHLKSEARDIKQNSDGDLKFYRDQLQKANVKIVALLTGQTPEPVQTADITSTKDSTGSVSE
ncbi:MAG: DNA-binding protein [Gammaproteobacteria bacterium]|nr:DNA-binding protein [Gammaproteobacteria bacterium]